MSTQEGDNILADYILASPAEMERLRLQAHVWEADAEAMLDRHPARLVVRRRRLRRDGYPRPTQQARRIDRPRRRDRQRAGAAGGDTRLRSSEGLSKVEVLGRDALNTELPRGAFDFVHERIEAAFGLRGDINIGRRTFVMLRQAGLEGVTVRAATLALQDGHPYMRLPIVGISDMRKAIVEANLSTDEELDDLLADVE
jgi:hypothetical protein